MVGDGRVHGETAMACSKDEPGKGKLALASSAKRQWARPMIQGPDQIAARGELGRGAPCSHPLILCSSVPPYPPTSLGLGLRLVAPAVQTTFRVLRKVGLK